MRARLLEATLGCLVAHGYAGTSAERIARAAGVTRGAQLHHFGGKDELLIAAVEHHLESRRERFEAAFAGLPPGTDHAAAAIRLLWSLAREPGHHAVLELVVAARTDPALRARVLEMQRRFAANVCATFERLFPDRPADPLRDAWPTLVLAVTDGLMVSLIAAPDDPRALRAVALLEDLARRALRPTRSR